MPENDKYKDVSYILGKRVFCAGFFRIWRIFMDDMKFPSKLFCGMDSLEKIYDGDYKSVLIISNGGAPMKTGSLLKIKRKFEMDETKAEIIISDSAPELFALTREYTEKDTPDNNCLGRRQNA